MKLNDALTGLAAYDPKYLDADILLSANENPYDLPSEIKDKALQEISKTNFNRYPDPTANTLRELIASKLCDIVLPTLHNSQKPYESFDGITRDYIVVGNGGDELLFNTFLAFGGNGRNALTSVPTFSVYSIDAQLNSTNIIEIPRDSNYVFDENSFIERASRDDIDIVILTSPNNPIGDTLNYDFVKRLLARTKALVLIDEAYGEFSGKSVIPLIKEFDNLAVLRTFSKAYALAGVRLGYMVANPKIISTYLMVRQPYSVDAVSQAIGRVVCNNLEVFVPKILTIVRLRDELLEKLSCINGLEVFESRSNFIMVRAKGAAGIWQSMLDDRILIRDFSSSDYLDGCLRITVGTRSENDAMIDSLAEAIMKGV